MSDSTTVARPYAKAIFNHALSANELAAWSLTLHDLAETVLSPAALSFITNPASTALLQAELLLSVCSKMKHAGDKKAVENLVHLLAENKRLQVLPDIYAQYESLRAEQEKTLTAHVSSFAALTATEQQDLINSLSQRLQRKVTLEVNIDQSLLGGAVIHAGDLVIDGSVRGKLTKLATNLAA